MSKEVKRYDPFGYDGLSALMHEDVLGDYVRHEDYEALEAERAEQWRMRRDAEADRDTVRAALAEVRAERDALLAERDGLAKDAELFRQLRDIPKERLGMPGVPCVAVPEGIRTGRYVTGEDLDAAMQGAQP